MSKNRPDMVNKGSIYEARVSNALQEFVSTLVSNFKLDQSSSTQLRVSAGTVNDQVCIGIQGKWRYNVATVTANHPGGAAGTYDVYVTGSDNVLTGTDPADSTTYGFGLQIVTSGAFPATPIYRKVGTCVWSGTAITSVTQTVPGAAVPLHAATHLVAGADPLNVSDFHRSGTFAARPAASAALEGIRYAATDTAQEYQVIGGVWVGIGTAGIIGAPLAAMMAYAGDPGVDPNVNWFICDGRALSRTTYASLFAALTFTRNGTLTNASPTVSGLSTTNDLYVGMRVTGVGVQAGTTILAIVNSTTVTLSLNATTPGTAALTFYPWGAGDGTTTFNLPDPRGRHLLGAGSGAGLTTRARGAFGGEETHLLTLPEVPAHSHTGSSGRFFLVYAGTSLLPGAGGAFATPDIDTATDTKGGGGVHNNMPPYLAAPSIIRVA